MFWWGMVTGWLLTSVGFLFIMALVQAADERRRESRPPAHIEALHLHVGSSEAAHALADRFQLAQLSGRLQIDGPEAPAGVIRRDRDDTMPQPDRFFA